MAAKKAVRKTVRRKKAGGSRVLVAPPPVESQMTGGEIAFVLGLILAGVGTCVGLGYMAGYKAHDAEPCISFEAPATPSGRQPYIPNGIYDENTLRFRT